MTLCWPVQTQFMASTTGLAGPLYTEVSLCSSKLKLCVSVHKGNVCGAGIICEAYVYIKKNRAASQLMTIRNYYEFYVYICEPNISCKHVCLNVNENIMIGCTLYNCPRTRFYSKNVYNHRLKYALGIISRFLLRLDGNNKPEHISGMPVHI